MLLYEQSGSVQKDSPWITSELKKRMHERDIMHEVESNYIHSKNTQDWGEFKRLRNKTNSNIKTTKESEYYKQSFTEHNNDSRRTCQL